LRCNAIIQKSRAQALTPFPTVQQTTYLNQNTTQYQTAQILLSSIGSNIVMTNQSIRCKSATLILICLHAIWNMELKIGMRVLEQHESVVIKGAMQHAAELLPENFRLVVAST
jgi:hypothetical protein